MIRNVVVIAFVALSLSACTTYELCPPDNTYHGAGRVLPQEYAERDAAFRALAIDWIRKTRGWPDERYDIYFHGIYENEVVYRAQYKFTEPQYCDFVGDDGMSFGVIIDLETNKVVGELMDQ